MSRKTALAGRDVGGIRRILADVVAARLWVGDVRELAVGRGHDLGEPER
jgi:hypothetical protein